MYKRTNSYKLGTQLGTLKYSIKLNAELVPFLMLSWFIMHAPVSVSTFSPLFVLRSIFFLGILKCAERSGTLFSCKLPELLRHALLFAEYNFDQLHRVFAVMYIYKTLKQTCYVYSIPLFTEICIYSVI